MGCQSHQTGDRMSKPTAKEMDAAEDLYFRLVDLSACIECGERVDGPELIVKFLADQKEKDAQIAQDERWDCPGTKRGCYCSVCNKIAKAIRKGQTMSSVNCGNSLHPKGAWHEASPLPYYWIEAVLQWIRKKRWGCGCKK